MKATPEQAFFTGAHFMIVALWCCLAGDAISGYTLATPAVALFAQIAGMEE
jgi:hypothetical protein